MNLQPNLRKTRQLARRRRADRKPRKANSVENLTAPFHEAQRKTAAAVRLLNDGATTGVGPQTLRNQCSSMSVSFSRAESYARAALAGMGQRIAHGVDPATPPRWDMESVALERPVEEGFHLVVDLRAANLAL